MIFDANLTRNEESERITFNIASRQPHCFGGIITIVDTGSPRTIISARDVYMLKIPLTGEVGKPIKGFGKGGVSCRNVNRFKFTIKSRDNKIRSIEMPVCIVDITGMSQEARDQAFQLPSIIGLDFLRSQRLKLVVDFEGGGAYFEEIDVAPKVKNAMD